MVAIEMLTNLNTISMEDLVDRMHVEKATNVEDVKDGVRGLLLTEGQWEEL
jgi:hypothetical protein